MAVVQISKIQLRRGKRNSESGIPQLSSAEMAWAVDTQELYIGNGSVAEGAPYVGNTKVLTEHDDILQLAESYQYAKNNDAVVETVSRSLQSKLDEYISILDFKGEDDTDDEAFAIAFTQLFKNTDSRYRKVLFIPNGEYTFTEDLVIPSNVIIKGETQGQVKLLINNNDIMFESSASNVLIENLTIERQQGRLLLSGLSDSRFNQIIFSGSYTEFPEDQSELPQLTSQTAAVEWQNSNNGNNLIKAENIIFESCRFENCEIGIKMAQSSNIESSGIEIQNCKFFRNFVSIYLQTSPDQRHVFWEINDCDFEKTYSSAVKVTYGSGFRINRSNFVNCGNGNSDDSGSPIAPAVEFGSKFAANAVDWRGNVLSSCYSDRQKSAAINDPSANLSFNVNQLTIPEVLNGDLVEFVSRHAVPVSATLGKDLAAFSTDNNFYTVEYQLTLNGHHRNGKLTIQSDSAAETVSITDHYQYSPLLVSSQGGESITEFEFFAVLRDNDSDNINDTIILSYVNDNGPTGLLTFDVVYGL